MKKIIVVTVALLLVVLTGCKSTQRFELEKNGTYVEINISPIK